MENSNLFRLNWNDVLKGVYVAFLGSIIAGVYTQMGKDGIHIPSVSDLETVGVGALYASVSYLFSQLTTNSSGKILKGE